jgi:hypothetical protein
MRVTATARTLSSRVMMAMKKQSSHPQRLSRHHPRDAGRNDKAETMKTMMMTTMRLALVSLFPTMEVSEADALLGKRPRLWSESMVRAAILPIRDAGKSTPVVVAVRSACVFHSFQGKKMNFVFFSFSVDFLPGSEHHVQQVQQQSVRIDDPVAAMMSMDVAYSPTRPVPVSPSREEEGDPAAVVIAVAQEEK